MKKTLIITAAALALAACSDQSKAERAAKKYLADQSNDGKIEIVEFGKLEPYTDVYDPAFLIKSDIDLAIMSSNSALSTFELLGDSNSLAEAKQYLSTADSLQSILDTVQKREYPIYRMRVAFRAQNALGVTIKDETTLYLSDDLSRVSVKSYEVR